MCANGACGCENFNGRIYITPPKTDGGQKIDVRGVSPIKVNKFMEGDVMVFEISYSPFLGAKVTLTVTPSTAEVGEVVDLLFTAKITKGSEDIISKTVTPLEDIADPKPNTEPILDFTFSVLGVTSNDAGEVAKHKVEAMDKILNKVSAEKGVIFMDRFYTGFVGRGEALTSVLGFESAIATSIKAAFGAERDYTFPEGESHIVWLFPADATGMGAVTGDANFVYETIDGGTLEVPNPHTNQMMLYKVVKTKNFYPGGETVKLRF